MKRRDAARSEPDWGLSMNTTSLQGERSANVRRLKIKQFVIGGAFLSLAVLLGPDASADQHSGVMSPGQRGMMMGPGMVGRGMMGQGMLRMPQMDPARGRKLFASKGCVACHSVNGVGGKHAPPLDATTMEPLMNPFEFAAKMWRGAEAMIYLQREELGEQIEFSGEELADIIAFVHHPEEQAKFSETYIAPRIRNLMKHLKEEEPHEQEGGHGVDTPKE